MEHAAAAGDLSRKSVGAAYPRMPLKFSLHKNQLWCPEELKEFLLKGRGMPQGNGLRVVVIPRERYRAMTSEQRLRLLDQALQARIFVIVRGAFDARREDLVSWLGARGKSVCQLSGRDDKAEQSVQLSTYLSNMEGYEQGTSAWSGSLGTFTCKNQQLFQEDVEFLEADDTLKHYLPWGSRSMLVDTLETEKSIQYGPYVFGGDKMRKHCEEAAKSARDAAEGQGQAGVYEEGRRGAREHGAVRSIRNDRGLDLWGGRGGGLSRAGGRERCDVRLGMGGSSMHLDGMGTLTAVGGVKAGSKLVTCVEAADAALALRLAKFKFYAKPGGSNFIVNDPVDRAVVLDDAPTLESVKQLWTRHGVRWGTFKVLKGDGYMIPAGLPHEFLNLEKALSIAWNIVPACEEAQHSEPVPWILLQRSLRDAEKDLSSAGARLAAAVDHAPATVLLRQAFPHVMTSSSAVLCRPCAERHLSLHRNALQLQGAKWCERERCGASIASRPAHEAAAVAEPGTGTTRVHDLAVEGVVQGSMQSAAADVLPQALQVDCQGAFEVEGIKAGRPSPEVGERRREECWDCGIFKRMRERRDRLRQVCKHGDAKIEDGMRKPKHVKKRGQEQVEEKYKENGDDDYDDDSEDDDVPLICKKLKQLEQQEAKTGGHNREQPTGGGAGEGGVDQGKRANPQRDWSVPANAEPAGGDTRLGNPIMSKAHFDKAVPHALQGSERYSFIEARPELKRVPVECTLHIIARLGKCEKKTRTRYTYWLQVRSRVNSVWRHTENGY